MSRVNVTKSFLPPIEEYKEYISKIWANGQLTNQGPLLLELETKIKQYLNVENFHFVTNGTMALQVALRALDIVEGEVITTPFSYVATTSSILWERCDPVFVDIESETFCIDSSKIEAAITPKTKAILVVHVFGFPCNVEEIEQIASKHNLKVIYDGAHAFGAVYKGRSLLDYGDISICSFHATKLFHTIEGGGIIVKDTKVSEKVELIKRFGHDGDEHKMLGINAKASEFQAAMGLVNIKHLDEVMAQRKRVHEHYDSLLSDKFYIPKISENIKRNYAYYPILFKDEGALLKAMHSLNAEDIYPRRYFYPSLNKIPYVSSTTVCETSEDISKRILCLPFYPDLEPDLVSHIASIVNACAE